jgi:LysM repeat protein
MLLTEFFGKAKQIHLKLGKDKDENKINNELLWFILDHDRLHKDYFYHLSKKLKAHEDDKSILDDIMEMVKKGCKEFYVNNKMEGKLGKLFPEELRKDVCQKLYDHYRENLKKLMEGGNLTADPDKGWIGDPKAGAAQQINLQVTNRSLIVPILNDLLASINSAYQAQYKEPLWNPKLLKSQKFLSGSSLHFFNVKGIPDKVFVEKKPKVGDIDTMVDKEKETDLESFLTTNVNKTIGPGTLRGFQRGNEQFSSLWELQDPPIKIQIDLEYVKFDKDEPTPWSRFSHSSDWNDIQAGVKGVFHKYLIQSFAVLSKIDFIMRKRTGRGKNKIWQDVPTSDAMFSFAVSSKEGGGLRAKYTPVLNPVTNEPEMQDGLPVMLPLPTTGYEKDIGKMFQSLFGVKMNPKAAEQLADKFWSFTGLLDVMNTLLEPEEKSRVLGSFLNKTFGAGAQELYKNDPQRDSEEKMAAIELLMKTTGAKPPEGMDLEQMRQEYVQAYKITAETLDEADDITAPPRPDYSRQGIQHIYNRLPDGRVSSMEMRDDDFIELCKEIADNGGNLNGIQINLKVDGAGIRFGKDELDRPFFMTSKVTEPLYADNVGYFTNFGKEKGQSQEQLARTQSYDDALAIITGSKFIQTLPADTIVRAEMLYNPMAQKVDGQLKFVNIPYDPKKLGKQMTLVPFMVKQYSTGESTPDQDKIIQKLLSAGDKNIKIITNKLQQKGIDVSNIIEPVLNLNPADKKANKEILDKARQELSLAIIDSPQLKGKNALGDNMEGIVINMPSGRPVKVTTSKMKEAIAAKMVSRQTFGDTKERTAVVAIGNFAGHKGHEQLINFAIYKANEINGTPFIFVGHKVGPDDPIDINTKLETLQKLFPGVSVSVVENQIGASGQETQGNIFKKIEYELVKKEPFYNNIIITVGSDQANIAKTAQQMQGRYSKFPPLSHVKVSTYVTPRKSEEGGTGVSTTQLRNTLKTQSEEEAFKVWSQAYNVQKLGAEWIKHLMNIARKNMGIQKPQQQPQPVAERLFNTLVRPRLVENDPAVRAVQQLLNKKGANLDIDGVLGPLTKKSIAKYLPKAETGSAPEPNKNTAVQGKQVKERMMPDSNFAGTPKHKLGPAAHLKGKMKRPARAGDLVGDAQESIEEDSYKIALGDNLSTLAKKFGTTVDALMKANPQIKDANRIQAGATLNVPSQGNDPKGSIRLGLNPNIEPDTRDKAAATIPTQQPAIQKTQVPTAAAPATQPANAQKPAAISVTKTNSEPGEEKEIKSILSSGPGYIEIKTIDGEIQRRKGNANWRMNNPGNIRVSQWTQQQPGFIGVGDAGPSGKFAVFATLDHGVQAKKNLLFNPKSKYFNLSIRDAITRYAPPSDNNPTDSYINQVVQGTKSTPDTLLSKLSQSQQDAMMDVINRVEGFKVGKIETLSQIAEEIVNNVASKLPKKIADGIRNAITRTPNKLQVLQQELSKRKIQGIAESEKLIPLGENYQKEISQLIRKILINEFRHT